MRVNYGLRSHHLPAADTGRIISRPALSRHNARICLVHHLRAHAYRVADQQNGRPRDSGAWRRSFTTTTWDPGKEEFGVLPEIYDLVPHSILGVALGTLFGMAVAIFLTQDFIPSSGNSWSKHVVELLAAIPSVVYGLWGIFVLIPAIGQLRLAERKPGLDPDIR